jgi:hypothetical protein
MSSEPRHMERLRHVPTALTGTLKQHRFFIQGRKVTIDIKSQLTSQMHDDNMRSLLMQKDSWSSQIFNAIDWNSSERALRRLSNNRQMNVIKLCHYYWHTGLRHGRFYGGERPCCFCKETKEDWRHTLNCPSLYASYHQAYGEK